MIFLTIMCVIVLMVLILWFIFKFTLWSLVTFWPLWVLILIVWLLCQNW